MLTLVAAPRTPEAAPVAQRLEPGPRPGGRRGPVPLLQRRTRPDGTFTAAEHLKRAIADLYPGLYPEAKPRLDRARAGELVRFRFSAPMPSGEIPFVGTYVGLEDDWVGAMVELDVGQALDHVLAEVRAR